MKRAQHQRGAAAIAFAALLWGCGPHYERHEVSAIDASRGGFLDESSLQVRVPEGAVLTANLVPMDSEDEIMEGSQIFSEDPDTLEVIRVHESEDTFAFVGRRAGSVDVVFVAEGAEVHRARATVTASR